MYDTLIVAILMAILGGVGNILYEKYFADAEFQVTKKLLTNRLGIAAFAGFLVYFGMADAPALQNLDLIELAGDFGLLELQTFLAFAVPYAGTGYFADDIVDIAMKKFKKE